MRAPKAKRPTFRELLVSARTTAFVVAFAYAATLWLNYRILISPAFQYMSFFYFNHSPPALLLDFTLAAAPTLFLPIAVRRPSDLALILLYIIVYIPSILFTTSTVTIVTGEIMALKVAMLATLWLIQYLAGSSDAERAPVGLDLKPNQLVPVLIALGVALVFVLGLTYGFSIKLHGLAEVYDQRAAFKAELGSAGYSTYLVGLLSNVLGPALVSYGLVFRRYAFIAAGAFFALFVFSITGLKSSIMALLYTFILFSGLSIARRSMLMPAVAAALVINLVAMATAGMSGYGELNDLFTRRTLMIQGVLTSYFNQYYVDHPFLYLSQSFLAPFIASPQVQSAEDLIGQIYFHGEVHANASIWADGFAQGGFVGIVVSAIITGLFLRAVNYSTSRADLKFACCAMSMLFFMLCQTGVIKVIGTHGGLAACLIFLNADMRRNINRGRRDILGRAAERRRRIEEAKA